MPAAKSNGAGNLRERIRKAEVAGKAFEVEGWGEKVELRSMTVAEKLEVVGEEGDEMTNAQAGGMLPKVIIKTCYDPDTGEPVFGDDDESWLSNQPASVIEPLALAGLRASGMTDEAIEEGKGGS